jgi:hypothetical protein
MYVHEQKGDPRANKHELDLVVEEIIKEKGAGQRPARILQRMIHHVVRSCVAAMLVASRRRQ